jgi:hypothetical protein
MLPLKASNVPLLLTTCEGRGRILRAGSELVTINAERQQGAGRALAEGWDKIRERPPNERDRPPKESS